MALQGTLETFALPDVLRLLASTKKTGAYRLEGNRGSGALWVKEGQIVGGEVAGSPPMGPTEVAFELLRFSDGDFIFDADAEHTDVGSPVDVETVLSEAEKLLGEWKDIEAVVPSLDHGVALKADLPSDEVTVRADDWLFVVGVAGGTTVGRLGDKFGLGELGVSRAVKGLVELGLVELTEPGAAPLPAPEPAPVAEAPAPAEVPAVEFEPEPAVTVPEPPPEPEAESSDDEDFEPFDPNALVIEEPKLPRVGEGVEFPEDSVLGGPGVEPEATPTPAPEPVAADTSSDPTDAAEIARQLANLSPKAAKAVAAAAKATTQEEREAALAEVDDTEDPINRELLLKFLGSVNS